MKEHLKHIAALAALLACTLAVFWFNASSLSKSTVTHDSEPDREPIGGDDHQNTETDPNEKDPDAQRPGDPNIKPPDDTPIADPWQDFLATFLTEQEAAAMTPAAEWSENGRFAITLLTEFEAMTVADAGRYLYALDKNGALTGKESKEKRENLFLYKGLLLVTQGGHTYVCQPDNGTRTDVTGYLPVYAVTKDGNAVFYKSGSFYAWNADTRSMTAVNEPSFQGLYYENVPATDGDLIPYRDGEAGLWGYADKNGSTVLSAAYRVAFPFGENGMAAVQKTKTGGLLFIDREGKTVYDPRENHYTYNGTEVYDLFTLPEALDDSAVGCLFFTQGYVIVTADTYAFNNSTELLRSRRMLIDSQGKILSLPEDYTVKAYSEGTLVLEKNGLYGYYSQKGYWIADPVYRSAKPFSGGVGVVCDRNGQYHAIDNGGNALFALSFDYVSSVSSGKMLGYREDKGWMLLQMFSSSPVTKE